MENITKALYMAAGVLIGLLILALFVFIFSNGGKFLASFEDSGNIKQIEKYNAELLAYQRDNNTIYDVITACNIAYDINKQNDYDNVNYLEIEINNVGIAGNLKNDVAGDRAKPEANRLKSGQIYNLSNNPVELNTLITQPIYGTDTLSTILETTAPGISANERKYKYIFEGTIEYDNIGKINKIIFNCVENT